MIIVANSQQVEQVIKTEGEEYFEEGKENMRALLRWNNTKQLKLTIISTNYTFSIIASPRNVD